MRINRIIIAVAGLVAISCCNKINVDDGYRIKPGDKIPEFSVVMNDGSIVSDVTIGSGPAMLVFFHTDCPDCRKELNIIQKFWDEHGSELGIYLISRAESSESVSRYWKEHGYTMPFSAQNDRSVYEKFSSSGIPLVIYLKDGIVKEVWDDKNTFQRI